VNSRVEADIVISCDSIVVMYELNSNANDAANDAGNARGEIFEKPKDAEDAKRMMRAFSGNTHSVISAVTLIVNRSNSKDVIRFYESTEIDFDVLDEATIDSYVQTSTPYDKAGGYGLQVPSGELRLRVL
jgi:predicted house-cleaning NTP pyrophosphatase (Maf/HAM1 superfamily)